ncbi:putative Phosphatidylinositol 4,5-bisphosphate-binding protein SLM1 [Glarea lozoyensis 74030]|uniref:Putative Phosphatidylinositol 4,5-bisphosphate-binding protein SLM1 n=1 Tax=Glarea lozoyensis (strain ATCC 74030 / MF5533) TaxID=1104152 RepID=H0EGE6_GLAL7|nr:putative Phosphatidylinositol 4,5-bisphosphate-binding protein SLM1 [Glarea lozoyensis 74030]
MIHPATSIPVSSVRPRITIIDYVNHVKLAHSPPTAKQIAHLRSLQHDPSFSTIYSHFWQKLNAIWFWHVARRDPYSLKRRDFEEEGVDEEDGFFEEIEQSEKLESGAFYSPVPTSGNPTEILANRFQSWRKVLKDLITYFREIQASYEHRSKAMLKISNVINNTAAPPSFLQSGGIDDALQILRGYHKTSIGEANKSKDIENDVILALVGLRSDLSQKIKEIKSLSGDFKNSVDKEMESTRKAVNNLQEGLGQADADPAQVTGKQDPYLLKLAADRQVEKQIDEENYLHQAYLNLEASGRELESIVVGEIQKSYNAYAGILKREADGAYNTVEELRTGPIAMPKDHEWNQFVSNDEHFVDPKIPIREPQNIYYPGRDNSLAQAIREGLLERKSKYLKSYTPGWYVLSPTHLHEFKSADKTQAPIMSLYLPEQKLGSNSSQGASSNKFMLKGRQTGTMHRGHSWVFRAESYETMLSWVEDIRTLTEKSPQERNAFVRQHARSISGVSQKAASVSSDGNMDEEDEEPFSTAASAVVAPDPKHDGPRRPQGGRFPSDLQVNAQRGLQAPLSPSSGSSGYGEQDRSVIAAAGNLPGQGTEHLNNYADHSPSAAPIVAAGIGGAAVSAVGLEAYHDRDHASDEAVLEEHSRQQAAAQAAQEASMIASPDVAILSHQSQTHNHDDQTANDSVTAAPNTQTSSDPAYDMSGGRSQSDLITANSLAADANGENPIKTLLNPLTNDSPMRPSLAAGQNHQSVASISQLHVPGEFPRASDASGKPGVVGNSQLPV